ncbi:MAG: NAD-dependent deacylase [Candidatus Aminicenantes bacterium]|nr:NAD-dependent deacylase [Candidatus Aminicenantes bacterium]
MSELETNLAGLEKILLGGPKIAVLTGAGISAESGIPTFRGEDGLWKKHRAEELATPQAFYHAPALVWEWYDWRRGIIASKEPNAGHRALVRWERYFPHFVLITQNVDGLHRRAGSQNVLELHGNIWEVRCTREGTITENYESPLNPIPPLCPACGAMLRPNVVWFGESLPAETLEEAYAASASCDLMFVIGTSAFVQPAASLPLLAAERGVPIVEVNPQPTPLTASADFVFRGRAGDVLPLIDERLPAGSTGG